MALSRQSCRNSAGFDEHQRAGQAPRFSGVMFYNEEVEETGGLIYYGKAIPGGQDSDVTLAMDQYRQDQNVYLHHEEHKDQGGLRIEDGLSISAHPDWTRTKEEYSIYGQMEKLSDARRDDLQLKSLQAGKIATRRLFYGIDRGMKGTEAFDDAGLFIKNKWGRNAIKLYVDNDNKPHFEVYDPLWEKDRLRVADPSRVWVSRGGTLSGGAPYTEVACPSNWPSPTAQRAIRRRPLQSLRAGFWKVRSTRCCWA